jgi:Holliday junction resolvase
VSGKRSRRKGAAGEREAAAALTEATGRTFTRGLGQARRGGAEVPDVVCESVPRLHVEVKRGKRPSLWAAREQAMADCKASGRTPIVLARRDRDRWVVLLDLDDLDVLRELL